ARSRESVATQAWQDIPAQTVHACAWRKWTYLGTVLSNQTEDAMVLPGPARKTMDVGITWRYSRAALECCCWVPVGLAPVLVGSGIRTPGILWLVWSGKQRAIPG